MKNSKKAFSLIEVIVAASILSIAVFGVFKLISENTKIINSSQKYVQANLFVQPIKECLDYLYKQNNFIYMNGLSTPLYIELGGFTDTCSIGDSSSVNILDDITYQLYVNKLGSGDDFIDWEIFIDSDSISEISYIYKQK